ncbi:hypothetical protein [Halarchaeum nitratireducens]|uniref:Uncharacterized protein n=1 Tax=Halarchaeum nitratireducens TaxID=489913 RepID=A0A830GH83_9EURY|nr:hypothetical protein [Halarchaeum nitratireducens]GGN26976.1 hypothetical protein GCM10009021_31850 [Halarchaeum nitratireducens]
MTNSRAEPGDDDWVAANKDKIREFAEGDTRAAWVFQRLLDNTDQDKNST